MQSDISVSSHFSNHCSTMNGFSPPSPPASAQTEEEDDIVEENLVARINGNDDKTKADFNELKQALRAKTNQQQLYEFQSSNYFNSSSLKLPDNHVNNNERDNVFNNLNSQGILSTYEGSNHGLFQMKEILNNENGLPDAPLNGSNYSLSHTNKTSSSDIALNSHSSDKSNSSPSSTEVRSTKQRRKSLKPVKSSVRYFQPQPPSPSPPPTLTSPPPPSLQLPPTPPSSLQPPLSPPLSDIQSSLSSLSPCSSINSEENSKSLKGPVPKLLPITSQSSSSSVKPNCNNQPTSVNSNSVHSNNDFNSSSTSPLSEKRQESEDDTPNGLNNLDAVLPPPPPYPKDKLSPIFEQRQFLADKVGSSLDAQVCFNEEKRTPPPPYHSHIFSNNLTNVSSSKKRSAPDECNGNKDSSGEGSTGFWSAVNLPSTLSVSPVPQNNLGEHRKQMRTEEQNLCNILSTNNDSENKSNPSVTEGTKLTPSINSNNASSAMAALLQQLAAVQQSNLQLSSGKPELRDANIAMSEGKSNDLDGKILPVKTCSPTEQFFVPGSSISVVNSDKLPEIDANSYVGKNDLSKILSSLINKGGNTSHKPILPALSDCLDSLPVNLKTLLPPLKAADHDCNEKSPPDLVSLFKSSTSTVSLDTSSVESSTSREYQQESTSPLQEPPVAGEIASGVDANSSIEKNDVNGITSSAPNNIAAMLAAMQGNFGTVPPLMLDSSLNQMLGSAGNSADLLSYSAMCGLDPNALIGSIPNLAATIPGFSGKGNGSENKIESTEKTVGAAHKSKDGLSDDGSDNSNNLANMAALNYLIQQQHLQAIGNSGSSSAGLNGLSALAALGSVPGMPPLSAGAINPESMIPLQHLLQNMRYGDNFMPMKRKPRSSNHTKSFHCSLCSKRFSLKDELEEHMLTHTSDELGNESYMQKSFACSECSFRTKYKFCLQRHMHIHSGEKPLVCPYCRYRSISKVSYDNHIRTHTGEKPFGCPYCSYKSSFKNNLTKHIKTHTGSSKPYTCNKCSTCFSSQIQLKAHMRLHLDPSGIHNCTHCLYTCMSKFELECHMRTHIVA